jgi:hypothetical protein
MATKNGWYIRVCKTQTEASQIKLWLGLGGNSSTHKDWFTWKSSDPIEIDFPNEIINVKEIWIKGKAIPEDSNVSMCVCYQDHVTQKMTFDDEEEHETRQGDSDDCEC